MQDITRWAVSLQQEMPKPAPLPLCTHISQHSSQVPIFHQAPTFALHTASACWDHQADAPNATSSWSFRFHHELLNCEFGGHSPYKDYISHVVDPADAITRGLGDYVVTDELYHPKVYDAARSTVFLTAFDQQASHEQSNASIAVRRIPVCTIVPMR